ncbi:hypothetical protein RSAG8_13217, partial [Rhizoctonia solani AG-8 WAC10335]
MDYCDVPLTTNSSHPRTAPMQFATNKPTPSLCVIRFYMNSSLSTWSSDSPLLPPRLYIYSIRTALTTRARSPSHLLPCLCSPPLPGVLVYAATPRPSLTLRLRSLGQPTQQSLGRPRKAIECGCIDSGRDFVQYYRHQPGNCAYVARSRKPTHDHRRKGNFGGWAQVTSLKDGPLLSKRDALDVMDKCDAGSLSHRSTDSNRIIIAISRSTSRSVALRHIPCLERFAFV